MRELATLELVGAAGSCGQLSPGYRALWWLRGASAICEATFLFASDVEILDLGRVFAVVDHCCAFFSPAIQEHRNRLS